MERSQNSQITVRHLGSEDNITLWLVLPHHPMIEARVSAAVAGINMDPPLQGQLLKDAQNSKVKEERRSDRLEQTIRDNDIEIAKLREQRDKRLGSLKELFGHLTGAAGDIRANLNQSIVSSQIPGRTEFLDE